MNQKAFLLPVILLLCFIGQAVSAQVVRKPIPDKLVVLTFDDAVKSHYTFVAPLLKKYGFGATFYVCEFPKPAFSDTSLYMSWPQIQELSKMGFEIGNHTWHHAHVSKLDKAGLEKELTYIEQKCDSLQIPKPVTFAYPGYDTRASANSTLQSLGYQLARIGGTRVYDPNTDHPFYIPSFSTAVVDKQIILDAIQQARDGKIVVLTVHGVPDEAHNWVTTAPALFEEFLKYLHDHEYTVIAMKDLLPYIDLQKAMQLPVPVRKL